MEPLPAEADVRFPTVEEDPALGLSHRAKMEILFAVMLGLFLGALDQTIVGPALPTIVTDLDGNDYYVWVDHDLPADQHDHRPVLGQAVRPLRPQADVHARHRDLPGRLGPVRPEPEHGDAHPLPRHPGHRRGRPVPGRAGDHRRPVHAQGTRQVPGPVRGRLRHRLHRRPAGRRLPDRALQLALDLLRQHPDRHRRAHRHPAAAADRQADRRDQELRPPRWRDLHGRHLVPARRPDQQAVQRLDRAHRRRLHPRRARRDPRCSSGAESRAKEPIVPLDLLRNRTYSASMVSTFFASFAFFGAIVFLPRWFQFVEGFSPTDSGSPPCRSWSGSSSARSSRASSCRGRAATSGCSSARSCSWASAPLLMTQLAVRHACAGGLALDVHRRPRRRPDLLGLHDRRPERRAVQRQLGVATSNLTFFRQIGGTVALAFVGTIFGSTFQEQIGPQMTVAGVPPAGRRRLRPGDVHAGRSTSTS